MRDYLRPDEVDAMVQAARKSGRHRVRDAAIILLITGCEFSGQPTLLTLAVG